MKSTVFFVLFLMCAAMSFAGNVFVDNISLGSQDINANTYQVNFDVSWENSWRTSSFESNYDAVWLVVKYREDGSTDWLHADVRLSGSVLPTGSDADFVDGIGLFLFRDTDGIGDVNFQNVSIRWNYGNAFPDDQILEICVLAIEMVYIPEAAFELGDIAPFSESNFQAGFTFTPYEMASEAALTLGGISATNLSTVTTASQVDDDFDATMTQNLPAAYPKGFNDFYIMKYETSEQQYIDFLNRLNPDAALNRYPDRFGFAGHGINDDGIASRT
ncbi:MAG: hypothetical protein AAFV80_05050 [Bacteroidota bacterium]